MKTITTALVALAIVASPAAALAKSDHDALGSGAISGSDTVRDQLPDQALFSSETIQHKGAVKIQPLPKVAGLKGNTTIPSSDMKKNVDERSTHYYSPER